jgi:hypothetical protein
MAAVDVLTITDGLQNEATFARWASIDDTWPLADVVRQCLSFRPEARPEAAQLRDRLLAAAPLCHPTPTVALHALATQHNLWLLHDSRRARTEYIVPFATHWRGLTRVPDRFDAVHAGANVEPVDGAAAVCVPVTLPWRSFFHHRGAFCCFLVTAAWARVSVSSIWWRLSADGSAGFQFNCVRRCRPNGATRRSGVP